MLSTLPWIGTLVHLLNSPCTLFDEKKQLQLRQRSAPSLPRRWTTTRAKENSHSLADLVNRLFSGIALCCPDDLPSLGNPLSASINHISHKFNSPPTSRSGSDICLWWTVSFHVAQTGAWNNCPGSRWISVWLVENVKRFPTNRVTECFDILWLQCRASMSHIATPVWNGGQLSVSYYKLHRNIIKCI